MPSYETLKNKQNELIRKALEGSVFLAPDSATGITTLTTATGLGSAAVISLAALPATWDDLGWLSGDGAAFEREVSNSDVTSWGSVTPTRTDVTADTSTLSVTCQETKMLTIGLATGADLKAATPDANTGEIRVKKPTRSAGKNYRALALAVDIADGGEIFIGRYFPRAKVSNFSGQAFGGGDDPITWGVTLTGEEDSTVGYSESWLFGGPGWKAALVDMGFPATA